MCEEVCACVYEEMCIVSDLYAFVYCVRSGTLATDDVSRWTFFEKKIFGRHYGSLLSSAREEMHIRRALATNSVPKVLY